MKISIGHGVGGRLMHNLIKEVFLKEFNNEYLETLNDSAVIGVKDIEKIAFTTDSYTVTPIFFPGGDIGKLAVCGTVNDLLVVGAKPLFISCSCIIEEGLEYKDLEKITRSISKTAKEVGVEVVTGDTKVVEKGKGDKVFINTSGIGKWVYEFGKIEIGDEVVISGSIGDHEIAILTSRGEFDFSSSLKSDCAPLKDMVLELFQSLDGIKFMRDPTRGGVGTVLNEIVEKKDFGIEIYEEELPVKEEVIGACLLLGYDPIYLANEGKVVMIIDKKESEKAIEIMKKYKIGREAEVIGKVVEEHRGKVYMKTTTGGTRVVDMLVGEQLPRIC
jgi:hydrogenase expression/formation protein HypE